jgi:hypothetical protein
MSGRLVHQLNWTHFFDFLAFFGFMTLLLGAALPHAKQCRIINEHHMNAAAAIAMLQNALDDLSTATLA